MLLLKNLQLSVLLLYSLFIYLDFFVPSSNTATIKYLSMICIFIISLFSRSRILVLCLFITLICDILLLFTSYYTIGIFLFSIVHLLYIYRHCPYKYLKTIYLTISLLPLVFILNIDLIYKACIIYMVCILMNFISCILMTKKTLNYQNIITSIAILLFIFCDIFTALYNITGIGIYSCIIWIFYTPSQLLIVYSATTLQ